MIIRKIFLVMLLFCSISIFGQNTKTIEELNKELKTATENNDFQKAEQLKKEIQQVEEKNAKLKQLEEDKKIAIFLEKYDEVIAIQKNIDDVKNGRSITPPNQQAISLETMNSLLSNKPAPAGFENALIGTKQPKVKSPKKPLSEYEFRDKIIGSMGMGFGSYEGTGEYTSSNYNYNSFTGMYETTYATETYSYEYSLIAFQMSNHRWWINKYLAGGLFADFVLGDGDIGSAQYGGQMALLGDFGSIVLPYTSIGLGFGIDAEEEEFYFPVNYKLGSYFFFNQQRSIGAFVELNMYFNNEYTPLFRFGLAWSRVKRKARK
jgi:hypothetical protein